METNFKPTIDKMRVDIKNTLQKSTDSLNIKIPTKTVPTAPIPVQTAYAVPIGNVSVAFIKSNMLMLKHRTNPMYHQVAAIPVAYFALPKQAANPTSNNPPIINSIQFIKSTS